MKTTGKSLEDYVVLSKDGSHLSLSASLKKRLSGHADLYISRDGGTAALVERPAGQLDIVVVSNGSPGYQRHMICSRVLTAYLRGLFLSRNGRIPAWYDAAAGAVLLGNAANDGRTEFSTDNFMKVNLQGIRKFDCQLMDGYVQINTSFRFRSEVWGKGASLAFVKYNDGSVVLENDGEACLVRKPEVLDFAKRHWRGKQLYSRILGEAVVISPDVIELSRIEHLEDFFPLELNQAMTADLGRDFSITLSAKAVSALGSKLAVYACGPYLALCSHQEGDISLPKSGHIYSLLLSQQIAVDFPQKLHFFLIPHGNLLVLSEDQSLDTRTLPQPGMFCRLLMAQEHGTPPMRYGAYRPVAKAT